MKRVVIATFCLFSAPTIFGLNFGSSLLNSVYKLDVAAVASELHSGADPNVLSTTERAMSALDILGMRIPPGAGDPRILSSVLRIANMLLAAGERLGPSDQDVLWFPIAEGDKDLVTLLIDHGASPTAKFRDGSTPVEVASRYNQNAIYALLLQRGAHAMDTQTRSQIALVEAASEDSDVSIATMDRALKSGALINEPGPSGMTALIASLRQPLYHQTQVKVILWLLEHGANPNVTGNSGFSHTPGIPLDVCVIMNGELNTKAKDYDRRKHFVQTVIRALLNHGALVSVLDESMKTPLHYAAKMDDLPAAETLIAQGARIMATDNDRRTPLDYAQSKDMIQLLEKNGAVQN